MIAHNDVADSEMSLFYYERYCDIANSVRGLADVDVEGSNRPQYRFIFRTGRITFNPLTVTIFCNRFW